jgi:hypothetical protein
MSVRRVLGTRARAEHWTKAIAGADAADDALTAAYRWARKELSELEEMRPEAAAAARWDLARNLAAFASRVPRGRFAARTGLTAAERWQLLNPWKQPPPNLTEGTEPQ